MDPVASRDDETAATGTTGGPWLLVVCSLEPWGTVQRRMQLMVRELMDLDPTVSVIYVEPAIDVPYALAHGDVSGALRRPPASMPRLTVVRTRKWLPRVLGSFADRSLARQVRRAVRDSGQGPPVLWVNDSAYARLVGSTDWPAVYDVTDDWIAASVSKRARDRFEMDDALLVRSCGAVVVCSPDLARSRGKDRPVELIPNGVDVDLFTTPVPRPADLPDGAVLLYPGTLHEDRLDVDLAVDLARSRPDASLVFVGPNALAPTSTALFDGVGNIVVLGARPYEEVPGYLQHADIVVIPHRITPFTESLDPIKAYECLAVGRPTVSTPVAGFRDLGEPVRVVDRSKFVGAVGDLLDSAGGARLPSRSRPVATWQERARMFAAVLDSVRSK